MPSPVVTAGMQMLGASPWTTLSPIFPGPVRDRGPVAPRSTRMPDDDGIAAKDAEPARLIGAIAQQRDRGAFVVLFGFYAPRIKTMLMRAGEGAESAEDIAQETMLSVWRKAAQYDPARAGVSAWIYAIARNLRVDRLRADQRAKAFALYEAAETAEAEGPEAPLSAAELERRVHAAMRELPQEQVEVVKLSFFEGRAHGDIARLLRLPLGTVKSRLRLAMVRLRNRLGDTS
jgi:RNA polymerase sigma-70 factor (ECF subfamily)